ncbi:MAG: cephalosporin-C deacetylase [Propionibacteriaceae bacterium]|jgi:cephalosporin-C deacetylase|nr:acetylxylan esterase [Propionibacteriaceae bacterium]MDX6321344.1 cephalosporin-C deacetylase [Propionibacteriaceae bacterium]
MPMFDLPLDDLVSYRPEVAEPADFDAFWTETVADARSFPLAAEFTLMENKLALIDTYDVTFSGFGGSAVKAWLHVPAGASGPLPTVVQYHGYSGGRGFPHSYTLWAQAGYAHFVMDTRGQGWSVGGGSSTPDSSIDAGLIHTPGFMTAGITDPASYYYRRVYADAIRLLEAARESPLVDPAKIVVTGGSQGGGITLAAAGIAPLAGIDLLGAAPDVPFLCHFRRATQLTDRLPYAEITEYLAGWRDHEDAVYRTLSYFDGVNLGRRATASALFSVGLMDDVCPPSTVFAAYNHYGSRASGDISKDIKVYSHNQHEGGAGYQLNAQLDWFGRLFG